MLSFLGGTQYQKLFNPSPLSTPSYPSTATVIGITDGDTIKIDTNQSVRLVAVSAPELDEPFGQEAADFLTNLLENQTITLEYEQGYEEDVYDRLVAYVFLNDTNVNIELVRNGLAKVTIYEKRRAWKYQDELLAAQDEAQRENLGVWSKE